MAWTEMAKERNGAALNGISVAGPAMRGAHEIGKIIDAFHKGDVKEAGIGAVENALRWSAAASRAAQAFRDGQGGLSMAGTPPWMPESLSGRRSRTSLSQGNKGKILETFSLSRPRRAVNIAPLLRPARGVEVLAGE